MVVDTDTNNAATQEDSKKGEFTDVPKEAIVRPKDEKPVRTTKDLKKNYQEKKRNLTTKV